MSKLVNDIEVIKILGIQWVATDRHGKTVCLELADGSQYSANAELMSRARAGDYLAFRSDSQFGLISREEILGLVGVVA